MVNIDTLTLTFARLYAFNPRVIKFSIDFIVAFPEPSPATTTATGFAGFRHLSALEACGTGDRRRVCWCSYGGIGK